MTNGSPELTSYQSIGAMAIFISVIGVICLSISPGYASLVLGIGLVILISGIYFMLADIHVALTKKN
jgi:hypothetical protein